MFTQQAVLPQNIMTYRSSLKPALTPFSGIPQHSKFSYSSRSARRAIIPSIALKTQHVNVTLFKLKKKMIIYQY